jgi:hypothetical protein
MANRHFGKLADVWKHGVLLEVLGRQPPTRYAETHAGSAAYPMVADPERRFGVLRLLAVADDFPALAGSPYVAALRPYIEAGRYPGSALLAMTVLGDGCEYLLCDLDPVSAADLRRHAADRGLRRCEVAERDGMATTAAWLAGGPAVVHIDPFEPFAGADGGRSAVQFAADVADQGHRLAYWYGYDQPAERAWAADEIGRLTDVPLWCGDIQVLDATGAGHPGHLGTATTAGTGAGVVLANVDADTVAACTALGEALAAAYADSTLPDGTPGRLAFTTR